MSLPPLSSRSGSGHTIGECCPSFEGSAVCVIGPCLKQSDRRMERCACGRIHALQTCPPWLLYQKPGRDEREFPRSAHTGSINVGFPPKIMVSVQVELAINRIKQRSARPILAINGPLATLIYSEHPEKVQFPYKFRTTVVKKALHQLSCSSSPMRMRT